MLHQNRGANNHVRPALAAQFCRGFFNIKGDFTDYYNQLLKKMEPGYLFQKIQPVEVRC